MGLLGLFKPKEERTHFERDEAGKVTRVTRDGRDVSDEPRGVWKSTRQLEREYYQKHPEKRLSSRVVKAGRSFDKRVVSKMKPIDMSTGRSRSRGGSYRIENNYNPFGSMFDTGLGYKKPRLSSKKSTRYVVVGGKAYPMAGSGKKKKRRRTSGGFGGYDMMDNWGFMK